MKYFKKAEGLDPHRNEFDPDAHGMDGPLKVTELGPDQVNEYTPLFVDSCNNATKERKVDIPKIGDYNSTQGQKGACIAQSTTYKGVREDTWTAYMKRTGAATERPNLDIASFAHVVKVNIDEETKHCGSVTVRFAPSINEARKAKDTIIYANREIILSGGAIASPHILMNSGVGPKEHLESCSVKPVIENKAVGANMKDHLCCFSHYEAVDEGPLGLPKLPEAVGEWWLCGRRVVANVDVDALSPPQAGDKDRNPRRSCH